VKNVCDWSVGTAAKALTQAATTSTHRSGLIFEALGCAAIGAAIDAAIAGRWPETC